MGQVRYDAGAIQALVRSPQGPVAVDLLRRGRAVEAAAKIGCPVDKGRLRSSITAEIVMVAGGLVCRIGTNVAYARAVHDGTGIYGPRGAPIRPVRAKVLAWPGRGGGGGGFAMYVKGSPGRPFLARALPAAAR